MKRHPLATLLAAPLLMIGMLLGSTLAHADTAAPTHCKDGTTSSATGRGACSGHGGVQKAPKDAAAAAPAAAPAATPAPSTVPPPGSAGQATSPVTSAKPVAKAPATAPSASSAAAPAGATAKCKDGSYSKSQHHSGSCSHHGGVAEWLTAH